MKDIILEGKVSSMNQTIFLWRFFDSSAETKRAQIPLPLCITVQIKGGKIFERQLFGGGGRKVGDHLEVAPALVAHLYPDFVAPAVRVQDAERGRVLIPAMDAPEPVEAPVPAALPAAQVPGLFVALQLAEGGGSAAQVTAAFLPRACAVEKGRPFPAPGPECGFERILSNRP
jgi:hypothetical protein